MLPKGEVAGRFAEDDEDLQHDMKMLGLQVSLNICLYLSVLSFA